VLYVIKIGWLTVIGNFMGSFVLKNIRVSIRPMKGYNNLDETPHSGSHQSLLFLWQPQMEGSVGRQSLT
jgi:hypothetical protein